MEAIKVFQTRTVVLPQSNIDTDQIIPARFLTTTTKVGLGKELFADWRYDSAGKPKSDFVLNQAAAQGCQVLIAGKNFGCGSSREHAPWALYDFGFRAVVSNEIADIFRNNSLKNGLLPILVDDETHQWLIANPGAEVTVDLQSCTLTLPTGKHVTFPIEAFARHCLLNGVDEMGFLLQQSAAIERFEQVRA